LNSNNNDIKSIYDNKVIENKRLTSAKKIIEELKNKDKLKIVADKKSTFFGVKSDKEDQYYTINYEQKTCNCFDYARYIDHNKDHKCKHLLAVEIAIKDKLKIAVKDLDNLKLAEYKGAN
jgi:predicted nucleic acid-binding Zn finger protein